MQMILAIAAGGAVGAVMRHFTNNAIMHQVSSGFPYGILSINIIGSILMGLMVGLFAHVWQPPAEIKAFLTVGVLGAFTTFSTFSLDVITLYERGAVMAAASYIGASVILSVAGLCAGLLLVRHFAS